MPAENLADFLRFFGHTTPRMEPEIAIIDVPCVFFTGVVSGTDYHGMIQMYDALFHTVTASPDYRVAERAVPPLES